MRLSFFTDTTFHTFFFYSTYGPAPNAGFFILPNRTVGLAQTWFSLKQMNASIAEYFA